MALHNHRSLPALAACTLCNPPIPGEPEVDADQVRKDAINKASRELNDAVKALQAAGEVEWSLWFTIRNAQDAAIQLKKRGYPY